MTKAQMRKKFREAAELVYEQNEDEYPIACCQALRKVTTKRCNFMTLKYNLYGYFEPVGSSGGYFWSLISFGFIRKDHDSLARQIALLLCAEILEER